MGWRKLCQRQEVPGSILVRFCMTSTSSLGKGCRKHIMSPEIPSLALQALLHHQAAAHRGACSALCQEWGHCSNHPTGIS